MPKFRKKPVIIEAWQWDGTYNNMIWLENQLTGMQTSSKSFHEKNNTVACWKIKTLEGYHVVSPDDFIICGIHGEYYPCKPDIFEKTYERVVGTLEAREGEDEKK